MAKRNNSKPRHNKSNGKSGFRQFKGNNNNLQDKFADKEYNKGRESAISPIMGGNGSDNDSIWYTLSQSITNAVASLSFEAALGRPMLERFGYLDQIKSYYHPVPGICSFWFIPSIGQANSANSPVNEAAFNLYSFIRHKNSGRPVGDAPNYMQYLIAMDSAYMFYMKLTRIYGTINHWSITDRYTPEALVNAMGVDYHDIVSNLSNFRAFINTLAMRLGIFAVPTSFTYISRHKWMCENVYKDSETGKAQYYFYDPYAYYCYSEGVPGQNGTLSLTIPKRSITLGISSSVNPIYVSSYQDLVDFSDTLLGPIFGSQDLNTMAGDLLKAFGNENLFRVNPIAENYAVIPTYSREVLSQMENVYIPRGGSDVYGIIKENTAINEGYLIEQQGQVAPATDVQLNNVMSAQPLNKIINFHWDNPTPDDIMVATRLASPRYSKSQLTGVTTAQGKTNQNVQLFAHSASEIVTAGLLWSYGSTGVLNVQHFSSYNVIDTDDSDELISDITNTVGLISLASCFDWHLRIPFWLYNSTTGMQYLGAVQDLDNFALVDDQTLMNIDRSAMLALFAIRSEGEYSIGSKTF